MSAEPAILTPAETAALAARPGLWRKLLRNPGVVIGGFVILLMVAIGLAAPVLGTIPPSEIAPTFRNRVPGAERTIRADDGTQRQYTHWMGTDSLGRDVYSRVLYGARVSILVGVTVAIISVAVGLLIGLVAGYVRWIDGIVMRLMDGFMAIPAILLAIALVSLFRAGLPA